MGMPMTLVKLPSIRSTIDCGGIRFDDLQPLVPADQSQACDDHVRLAEELAGDPFGVTAPTVSLKCTLSSPACTSPEVIAVDWGMNLLVQVVAIVAMRSIGLFYRHYGCYFKW